MIYQVEAEIGSKDKGGNFGAGLYFHAEVDGRLTLDELYKKVEQQAYVICRQNGEEFVEVVVNRIR